MVVLSLYGCGVSTAELRDDGRAQTDPAGLELEAPGTPSHDAGRSVDEERIEAVDAGRPVDEPTDAGRPTGCEPGARRACATSCGSASTQGCVGGEWGRCEVPREVCDDGVDNDCDGRTDERDGDCPPPRRRCEDTEGGSCNGDPGHGNRCAPSDNTGGCSPARFHAWCNRRNPATPGIWEAWIRRWVDDRCDGALAETGTQYSTWFCTSSNHERFECTTPLVLSFDGAPVVFQRRAARFAFTAGRPLLTDWPGAATPWLARDLDGNGLIDDGSELFGSDTRVGRRTARHGFEALAALDANHDGAVDAKDPAFATLLVWRDADGDKRSSHDEVVPLSSLGVTALSTDFTVELRCDGRGNCERERSRFTTTSGRAGELVDVYLATQPGRRSHARR